MDEPRCYRPLIIGRRGAVAANHPLAAQAGLLALRAGGNAVDAAVATAMTLAVVEPMMSGLGGDGFYHVYDQATGRAIVFNGSGPAPAAAVLELYAGGIPRTGPLSVSVPGTVAGLGAMHRKYGRLPWRDLFAEAIAYARDGFGATRALFSSPLVHSCLSNRYPLLCHGREIKSDCRCAFLSAGDHRGTRGRRGQSSSRRSGRPLGAAGGR